MTTNRKPCDEPKFIDEDDAVALAIKDYERRTDVQFLMNRENPENDSDDLRILGATKKVAQRAHYDSDGCEAGLTKSFDIIDVMMAAQQLAEELQQLVDDWWGDDDDESDEPDPQPPPAEERPPPAPDGQSSLF